MIETILNNISKKYPMEIMKNAELSAFSTFKIGGIADYVILPENADALSELCAEFDFNGINYMVIGNGSNLLFSDEGFRGAIIVTSKIDGILINGTEIVVGCGANVTKLARKALEASLTGMEFMYGIPGTVGGTLYMNAGAFGGEISSALKRVRFYDSKEKKTKELDSSLCEFSYRTSIFEKNPSRYTILEAVFELENGNKEEINVIMNDYMSRRRDKQPLEYPSAGSVFKRINGYFTAKLIEEAGLKGYSIGAARVSEKHAGFIINTGDATANDVKCLIEYIKSVIKEKYALDIECEIKILDCK